MGAFDRRDYVPAAREPERESVLASVAWLARPLLAAVVVGVLLFGAYKVLKTAGAAGDAAASDAQMMQMAERIGDLEHRLNQLEQERKTFKEHYKPAIATANPVIAAASTPLPSTSQLLFSRPVSAQSAPSSPANSPVKASPATNLAPQSNLNSERAATASSQQQWEATADRLGNVVGELDSQRDALDSQRDAIARDQARLDELARRFARNSQPFTLEAGGTRQQVGPVWLRLRSTDPRNQRYTMRVSVNDKTVELKDRALHEAIQFYASGGKLSFELVVSQIARDSVEGRVVLPQAEATR